MGGFHVLVDHRAVDADVLKECMVRDGSMVYR
jgi:hypothetical protein